jgi:hypothetical protein
MIDLRSKTTTITPWQWRQSAVNPPRDDAVDGRGTQVHWCPLDERIPRRSLRSNTRPLCGRPPFGQNGRLAAGRRYQPNPIERVQPQMACEFSLGRSGPISSETARRKTLPYVLRAEEGRSRCRSRGSLLADEITPTPAFVRAGLEEVSAYSLFVPGDLTGRGAWLGEVRDDA